MSVMVLQGCKSTLQKSRPIESGHGRHAVQVANVCGYKNEFQFLCELDWFLHGQSHIIIQDYKPEEDPAKFQSTNTGRGPDWMVRICNHS